MTAISTSQPNKCTYIFPENSVIEGINFEGLAVNTLEISIGGIGYGVSASQLLAHGMKAIGSNHFVCNLPFSLECYFPLRRYNVINHKNEAVDKFEFKTFIEKETQNGITHFNFPLDFNSHASLMHGTMEENGKMEIVFFDSFKSTEEQYKDRYDSIMTVLKEFLPMEFTGYKIYHILDQGGEESSGCGYYTLQTAHLLKERTAEQLLQDFEERGEFLFTAEDDIKIRCELAVRAILHDGIDHIDTPKLRYLTNKTTVYHKLGPSSIHKVIQFVRKRIDFAIT